MNRRRWIIPAALALPFVLVVVADVAERITQPSSVDLDLLGAQRGAIRFHELERVVDLRRKPGRAHQRDSHGLRLAEGWGEATPQGTWTASNRATLVWDLDIALRRVLWIEGRVDRRKGAAPDLRVVVNGAARGAIHLSEKVSSMRFDSAGRALAPGRNEIRLELVGPDSAAPAKDRTLLLQRLALTGEGANGIPSPDGRAPVAVNLDAGTLTVRRPGRLMLPFQLPMAGCELRFRYRFRGPRPDGRADVVVGRRFTEPGQFREVRSLTLDSGQKASGRFRQILHDRFEPNVLILDVNEAAAQRGLVIKDLKLVSAR
jgi:hypothetical protein